jgi:hypothetical protein
MTTVSRGWALRSLASWQTVFPIGSQFEISSTLLEIPAHPNASEKRATG